MNKVQDVVMIVCSCMMTVLVALLIVLLVSYIVNPQRYKKCCCQHVNNVYNMEVQK